MRSENPELKVYEVGKLIGCMWRDLSSQEKQEYFDEYEMDKREYNNSLKSYHDSPAYQSWLKTSRFDSNSENKTLNHGHHRLVCLLCLFI